MKNLLSVFVLLLSFVAYSGNNDIYLTQTGTGLTIKSELRIRWVHHKHGS